MDLSGCVSVSLTRSKAVDPVAAGGSLDVAVYDTPAQARAGVTSPTNVHLDLSRLEEGRERSVRNFLGSTCSVDGLAPGEYRLHLKAESASTGTAPPPAPIIRKESIRIKAGESVRAKVILKKFPTWTVVGVTLGVGAVAGALIAATNAVRIDNLHLTGLRAKKARKAR
jgi:hypothetical protein